MPPRVTRCPKGLNLEDTSGAKIAKVASMLHLQAAAPVRINTHGMYARVIEDTDYIVPRGGRHFEVRPRIVTLA